MKNTRLDIKNLLLGFTLTLLGVSTLFVALKTDISKTSATLLVLSVWTAIGIISFKQKLWKSLCIFILLYAVFFGLVGEIPFLENIKESARNLYFHVTMWFSMLILFGASIIYSLLYLWKEDLKYDAYAEGTTHAGTVMGFIGLFTGMVWARFTWGAYWSGDPKQIFTAIGLLLYIGYFILRGSFTDEVKKARLSAVVNVFAFPSMIVLLYVLPRAVKSLHPGAEGSMSLSSEDINSNMRLVFYPAIVGWTLLGTWMATIRIRTKLIQDKIINL